MYILLFKEFKRGESMPYKVRDRIKHGKGKLASKAQGDSFNRYESTDKSVPLEIGTDDQRQEAKLYQRRNTFQNVKVGEPKVESTVFINNSANRAFLKAAGKAYAISKDNKKLTVILSTPAVHITDKGRSLHPKVHGRSSIKLPINSSLNAILTAAFRLCAKLPEDPIKRKQVCHKDEAGWSVFPKGDYVLNCKIVVVNDNGTPLKSLIGTASKGLLNIHEVRLDKMKMFEKTAPNGKKSYEYSCLFNKSTIARYSAGGDSKLGMLESIQEYVAFEAEFNKV
jgi:hypothetical protein